jgi:hypothetical protein
MESWCHLCILAKKTGTVRWKRGNESHVEGVSRVEEHSLDFTGSEESQRLNKCEQARCASESGRFGVMEKRYIGPFDHGSG